MKTRFRIKRGWFGRSKIVLQVGYSATSFSLPVCIPSTYWVWRDATEEDFINRDHLGSPNEVQASADALGKRFEGGANG